VRILYLHQHFVPPDANGGTRSYEFARRWIANGHDICMVTSSASLPTYKNLAQTSTFEIADICCIVIPVPYSNLMSYRQRIKAFLKFAFLASRVAATQKADVIFATSTPLTIAIPAIVGRIRQRIPLVFEVRDLWPAKPIAMGMLRNPLLRLAARALEWVAYHASAHVIVLSPDAVWEVEKHGIGRDRISMIPNSCDITLFNVPVQRGDWVRERLQLTPEQPLVVYTGTLGRVNGLGYAIDMAHHLRDSDIYFLLVGTGIEREKVYQQAIDLEVLDHNLSIWDPLPKAQIPDVLAAATLATSFVIPVRELWDNSANKFFDALAAGKPIAINYGGWQADLLTETGAGIVLSPEDPAAGAQKLAKFVANTARMETASHAARNLAREQFDRDIMAKKLEAILREVARQ
jgi:glycosyltransferase involved in cell wall biosynthesis